MQLQEIVTDPSGHELTSRGSVRFPVTLFANDMRSFVTQNVPWHWHEECEIVHVREGVVHLEAAGSEWELCASQAAFVRPDELHAMHAGASGACRMTNLLFDAGVVGGAPFSIFHEKYVAPVLAEDAERIVAVRGEAGWEADVLSDLAQIEDVYDSGEFGREMRIRNLLSSVWCRLAEHTQRAPEGMREEDPYIRDLMRFIHANFDRPLTLEEIAASAGISTRTCNRSFREQLHMSVFEYLVEYRVKKAGEMLASGADSVSDICFAAGFTDASYFARVFRAHTGHSPRAYRKLCSQPDRT